MILFKIKIGDTIYIDFLREFETVIFFLICSILVYFVIDLQRRNNNNETNIRLSELSKRLEKEGVYKIVHLNVKPQLKSFLEIQNF
jgi:hypothetical protein